MSRAFSAARLSLRCAEPPGDVAFSALKEQARYSHGSCCQGHRLLLGISIACRLFRRFRLTQRFAVLFK